MQDLKEYYSRYGGYWIYPDMLDFCYLVNPYFTESRIIDEMQQNFRQLVSDYPSGLAVNSKLASQCWGINEEYIIPGNGAAELIKALFEQIKGNVGIVRPTFEEYPNRLHETQLVTFVPQNDEFRYNAEDLIEYFTANPIENLLLINPDNPSGNFIPIEGVHRLAQWCENNEIQFVLDESFVDFSVGYAHNSFIRNDILEQYPHMCVIKSISKSYGVPGIRLGICCSANASLIFELKKQVSIWNINSFAQFFMQIFPKYREDYIYACDRFIKTRKRFESELKKLPYIKVMPSQANYFLLEIMPPYSPVEICSVLLKEYNILVSACLAKKGIEPNKYMRVAVRDDADNAKFIKALSQIIR